MTPMTLREAAEFLGWHYETVRRKAISGDLPGCKMGHWRFFKEDLVKALRGKYPTPALRGKEDSCSASSKAVESGIVDSQHQTDKEYAELLAQLTGPSRKPTNSSSKKGTGVRKSTVRQG